MAATTARSVMDGKEMAGYPSMMIRNIFHPEDLEGFSPHGHGYKIKFIVLVSPRDDSRRQIQDGGPSSASTSFHEVLFFLLSFSRGGKTKGEGCKQEKEIPAGALKNIVDFERRYR